MNRLLLDTSALSAIMRSERSVEAQLHSFDPAGAIWISTVTDGEIRYGMLRLSDGRRKQALLREYEASLSELTGLLPVTAEISQAYAQLRADLEVRGTPLADNDLWIASTALAHDLTLITTDRHFDRVPGLTLGR